MKYSLILLLVFSFGCKEKVPKRTYEYTDNQSFEETESVVSILDRDIAKLKNSRFAFCGKNDGELSLNKNQVVAVARNLRNQISALEPNNLRYVRSDCFGIHRYQSKKQSNIVQYEFEFLEYSFQGKANLIELMEIKISSSKRSETIKIKRSEIQGLTQFEMDDNKYSIIYKDGVVDMREGHAAFTEAKSSCE